jgi:hypothetical protein
VINRKATGSGGGPNSQETARNGLRRRTAPSGAISMRLCFDCTPADRTDWRLLRRMSLVVVPLRFYRVARECG